MTIWFTSDHHFGHDNIRKFCNRPFDTVEEMDLEMMRRWNERVQVKDTVYHIGDFTLGNEETFWKYREPLKGKIFFVLGGHDHRWWTGGRYMGEMEILPPLYTKKFEGHRLTLCHYPMLSWEQSHYGAHHLHGHTHGTIGLIGNSGDTLLPPGQIVGKRLDVGVDMHDFYPISLEQVLSILGE